MGSPKPLQVIIDNGASLSDVADLKNRGGVYPVAILVPTDWDTADIRLLASLDNLTFAPYYDRLGNAFQITVGALTEARWYYIDPAIVASPPFLKLQSWDFLAPAAVPQTAERILQLMTREA